MPAVLVRLQKTAAFAVVGGAVAACGGTTQFRDNSAIVISVAAPKPPEPEPKPEPKAEPKPEPKPKKRVEVKASKIEINEKIQFAYNDSAILEQSHSLLDEIADVIKKNSQIKKILIEGHASSDGDDKHNLDLSAARAKAVRDYLIKKGIKADTLDSKGFGEAQPIASNDNDEGKEKNRRVEFTIVKQSGVKQSGVKQSDAKESAAKPAKGSQ